MSNMRLVRGSLVEVLNKKKDLLGAWHCAEIEQDHGDGYTTVRYYRGLTLLKPDKVSTKAVRPRPAPVVTQNWTVGDVVEVLDDCAWRVSMITEVFEDGCYNIEVIGSVDEFKVKNLCTRPRQEWRNNQWILKEKDSGIDEKLLSRMRNRIQMQRNYDLLKKKEVEEAAKLLVTLKRPSRESDNASFKRCKKHSAVVDKAKHVAVPDSYSFVGKVDTPVYLGVKIISNNANSKKYYDALPLARTSETDDCVSVHSSVASCSGQDTNQLCSDAESADNKGDKEEMNELKDSKLSRYRFILETLYASGPLSWEQELLLTNLRMKHRVSNDEHLMEVRRLKSMGVG